jgi:hypothetical protein
MGFQVSRPNRVMTDRAHLSCFTISAASGNRLRHTAQSKSQRNRSNNDYLGRPSPGACLCQLGFLFNCEFQLQEGEPARTFRRFLGGVQRRLFWAAGRQRRTMPRRWSAGYLWTRRRFAYSAAWRRGRDALSSAWPKSSIRSSTSSRPTDNLSNPGAMPSAARCSGLSR